MPDEAARNRLSQLTDALLALVRALVHLQSFGPAHPMVPSSLDEAHGLLFPPEGAPSWPVTLRRHGEARPGRFEVVAHPGRPADVASRLPHNSRDRMLELFDTLFESARIDQLSILPGSTPAALRNAFVGLWGLGSSGRAQGPDDALRMLIGSGSVQVLPIGPPPPISDRTVSPLVARHIFVLQTVLGVLAREDRARPLELEAATRAVCEGLVQMTDDLRDLGALLTCADLATAGLDPSYQHLVLTELAAAFPAAAVQPIAAACGQVVARHGGASSLGDRRDARGTPLVRFQEALVALGARRAGGAGRRGDASDEPHDTEADLLDGLLVTEGTDATDPLSRRIMRASARHGVEHLQAAPRDEVDLYPEIELGADDEIVELAPEPASAEPDFDPDAATRPSPFVAPSGEGWGQVLAAPLTLAEEPPPEVPVPARVPPPEPDPTALAPPPVEARSSGPATVPGVEPPPPLDARVHEWMARFDSLGPPLMERVRKAASDRHYDGAITILAQVAAAFLEAGDYRAVIPILRLFKSQERQAASWSRERALSLAAALGLVLHRSRARAVVQALPEADAADRDALFELLCAYGPIVVPPLAAQLLDTRASAAVRKEIFAIIEGMGQPAGRPLVAAIARNARRWNRVLPLIRLVGSIGYREAEPILADFLKHHEPAVRAETLLSLHGALGRESEPYLVEALDDGHSDVRQRAVSLLAVLGSSDPRFLGTVEALLLDALGAVESGEALVIAAVHAIQTLGPVTLPSGAEADTLLANLLRGTSGSVVTRVRGKPRPSQSTAVLVAACETLGVIGGERALAALGHASRSAGPVLRQAATRALERLHRRAS
ncbi:MAG: HEAT repeat domain-containing protein [Deltaproteobacteria bacterium]|nr:HEAT repeat domain-containing protein [Deltaproteobacteria bacterium]